MTTEPIKIEFNGILGRREFESDRAALHFYPYNLSVDRGLKPVLVVEFRKPQFDKSELERLECEEVSEIEVDALRGAYSYGYGCRSADLYAAAVLTYWRAYDIEDFRQRIQQLEQSAIEDAVRRANAIRLVSEGVSLAKELIRRVEIKSAGAQGDAHGNDEAIAVLRRIIRHFEPPTDSQT